jgi:hypothetical protein
MKKVKLFVCLLIGSALFASMVCTAGAQSIVASNMPSGYTVAGLNGSVGFSNGGTWTNAACGQEFTAGIDARLSSIVASVDKTNPGDTQLKVSIYSADGSYPGVLLGSGLFPSDQIAVAGMGTSEFDFTSKNIDLVAGMSYVVTFAVSEPIYNDQRYRGLRIESSPQSFGFPSLDSPDGGASWTTASFENEIGLTVLGVPEPSSIAILLTLALGGLFWRLRRS